MKFLAIFLLGFVALAAETKSFKAENIDEKCGG